MNILVSANDGYMLPLKVMLTSLLETNSFEHHNIYFLYNHVQKSNIKELCQYVSNHYDATVLPYYIDADDFQDFPVSHHFSIETYYRFLAQDIIPKTEDRVLWLDADMIVKKSIKDFYYQDFNGKYLVVCQSINKNPQILLEKLNCPPGTVYFNAGTILFNLNQVRNITLADYHKYFVENKERITWLDQDILNGMYARKTKIADYRLYNMQMFSGDHFSAAEKRNIEDSTAIVHYIGPVKPWQTEYKNPCGKYWLQYVKKVWTSQEYITFLGKRSANGCSQRVNTVARKCKKLFRVLFTNGDILYPLRRLHGQLHEWRLTQKRRFALWKYITFPLGKKIYILGTPIHTNIGDSAIVLAEKCFLRSAGIEERRIIELTAPQLRQDGDFLARCIGKRNMICWQGGGNMGNQWMGEETLRRDVMAYFSDNPAIIFPQTIYYTLDEVGQLEQERSVSVYNGQNTLTMVAREQTSYEIMGQLYPDTALLLTPDIVLSATMETFGVESCDRNGVLLCMRGDAERAMSDEDRASVESILREQGLSYRITDMHCEVTVTKENRLDQVREKMQEFVSTKLVITDRLHGMVFAAITGTPCIVFSNYNHKVRGTYEWIKYLPYIRYAETVEDVERYLPELLAMENCQYDNTPLMPYFEELAQVVRDYANY